MDTTRAKRRVSPWLLAAILVTVALLAVGGVFAYYLVREELPTLPIAEETEPAFAYSIYGVDEPLGLALSPDGNRLYVTERGGERYVRVFDPRGNLLMNLFPPDSTFRQPTYVAVNPWGHVFVNDRALEGLSIYSPEGEFLGLLNPAGEDEDRWRPMALAFDGEGNLYVTELSPGLHRVQVFDHQNNLKLEFGSEGSGPGEFSFPNGIAVEQGGNIWVADSNNRRIQVFDPEGSLLAIHTVGGGRPLALPRGIAFDSRGEVLVADTLDHTVVVYSQEDSVISSYRLGEYGAENGQFRYPNGLAIDGKGHIYIADRDNNRVQVFK